MQVSVSETTPGLHEADVSASAEIVRFRFLQLYMVSCPSSF
jgi:hypothetical protein